MYVPTYQVWSMSGILRGQKMSPEVEGYRGLQATMWGLEIKPSPI